MPVSRHIYRHVAGQVATTARDLLDGAQVDRHRHDQPQVVFPVSGVLAVTTEAGSWVLPGITQAILIPPRVTHAHTAHGRTRIQTVLLPQQLLASTVFDTGAPRAVAMSPLAREVINTITEEEHADEVRAERLAAVLADELSRGCDAEGPAPLLVPRPRDPRLVQVVESLLVEPENGHMADLARAVLVSERTLSRLCREDTGLTFPRLRTRVRLLCALVRLADGETVTTVAHRCGWSKPHTFIDAFREMFGTTPAHYQRTQAP
ncbi:helix-turn-helix transcriptional regulator [Spiractinospora alimapuensis]|uniref:AraC family transcriptional regulator n=1 Tax=Spiractinospora alimapuensis TaxID=2820884 RepID=UPI001F4827ED|nr:helix-turn-helix transcriptional regulator [Spiractinospora alimapuensis]QVQ52692.1 helix-turn-helix transcriptional regulator [Spiractinospora alimapuensis]